jgi:alpha-ketoglutaric semialdehyde dehydrogenase
MLTRDIHAAYSSRVLQFTKHPNVRVFGRGGAGVACHGQAALFTTDGESFRQHRELSEEVFGAAALVVRCRDMGELRAIVRELEGQLTVCIHVDDANLHEARELLPLLELKAGRIVFNGFGTGVEVGHAMVHGGPYPATSDARTTSVGSLAIRRFLRPVAYQDVPESLLPDSLKNANPLAISRLLNGQR